MAIASARPPLPAHVHRLVLVVYYLAVLIALVLMYGINPPSPPPFIYQGF